MLNTVELNEFLAAVEKRAYAMALTSVKNSDDALDIVQDVMLTLAQKYAHKPPEEWRPLFYRILKNRMTDWHRSRMVRDRLFGWLNPKSLKGEEADSTDPVEQAVGAVVHEPEHSHESEALRGQLRVVVGELPARQQQAFMLRAWEGMDVRETASVMGCSQGSVKTHYSRAIHTLRDRLGQELGAPNASIVGEIVP